MRLKQRCECRTRSRWVSKRALPCWSPVLAEQFLKSGEISLGHSQVYKRNTESDPDQDRD